MATFIPSRPNRLSNQSPLRDSPFRNSRNRSVTVTSWVVSHVTLHIFVTYYVTLPKNISGVQLRVKNAHEQLDNIQFWHFWTFSKFTCLTYLFSLKKLDHRINQVLAQWLKPFWSGYRHFRIFSKNVLEYYCSIYTEI